MNKKVVIGVLVLFIIVIVCSVVQIYMKKDLINNSKFKKIYNNIEQVEVYILNIQFDERIKITNKNDIIYILDNIKNEKIKTMSLGESILGGSYLLEFKLSDGETIIIGIQSNGISIDGKNYSTDNDLKDKIKSVIENYTLNGVNN